MRRRDNFTASFLYPSISLFSGHGKKKCRRDGKSKREREEKFTKEEGGEGRVIAVAHVVIVLLKELLQSAKTFQVPSSEPC